MRGNVISLCCGPPALPLGWMQPCCLELWAFKARVAADLCNAVAMHCTRAAAAALDAGAAHPAGQILVFAWWRVVCRPCDPGAGGSQWPCRSAGTL